MMKINEAVAGRLVGTIIILSLALGSATGQKAGKKEKEFFFVKGKVLTTAGKPVMGEFIYLDNVKTNVITQPDGSYRIKVSSRSENLGIKSEKFGNISNPIIGQSKINFILADPSDAGAPGNDVLDEKINAGYGTSSRRNITTQVNKVKLRDRQSYKDIFEMLQGVPGVEVRGSSVRLRGTNSVNLTNEPLFVVDGVAVNRIDHIDPVAVESIEVLKGASASIYGSRGGNGVILITTKSGSFTK